MGDFDSLSAELDSGGSGGVAGLGGNGGSVSEQGGAAGSAGTDAGSGGEAGSSGAGGSAGSEVENLFLNPDFEVGGSRWSAVGGCTLALATEQPRSPSNCLCTTNRTADWEGPGYNLLGVVENGAEYSVQVWARMMAGSFTLAVTHKHRCVDVVDPTYQRLSSTPVGSQWSLMSAVLIVPECELAESLVYVEGAPAGESFCIDDVSLLPR